MFPKIFCRVSFNRGFSLNWCPLNWASIVFWGYPIVIFANLKKPMQHWAYLPTTRRVINRIKGQGQNRAGGELDLVEAEVDSIDAGRGSSVERNNAVDELEEQFTHKNNNPTSTTIHPSDPDFVSVSPTQVCVCLSYHCFTNILCSFHTIRNTLLHTLSG